MSTASPPANILSAGSSSSLAIGQSRVLWQNTTTGDRSIWVMNGTSYSSAVILPTVPTQWSIAGAGDFNGDGNADILWQNLTTGDRSIWLMNGNSYSSAVLLPNVPTQWSIAGVGDFNADGKSDIVWQNTVTGDRSIWFMNGVTYSSAALLPNVSTAWKIVAVGDFNADNKPDLVWQRSTTGESSIWFMNGGTWSGTFALLTTVPLPWRIAGAADFDGDIDADLIWQNVNTGERSIWLMNGATLTGAAILPTVPTQWSIAAVIAGPPAPQTPVPPSALTATPVSTSQINLAWQDNSTNETGFRIEQCVGINCTSFVELGTALVNNVAANIIGLSASTTYRYRVRAYNAVGNSDYSNIASATTPGPSVITVYASADNTIAFATNNAQIANTVYTGGDFAVGCAYSIGQFVSDAFCNASLLKFDAATAQIAGHTIVSAYLDIQPDLLPADWQTFYTMNAVAAAWNPSTVTYNNQPTAFTYGQINFNPPTTGTSMRFDVTTWVQLWALGATNGGWTNNGIIIGDGNIAFPSNSYIRTTYFQSLENFSASGNRPRLTITIQ